MPDNYAESRQNYHSALYDFQAARRKAILESLLSALRGRPTDLLSYDEVRQKIRTIASASRNLETIPLDKIVGSVNRYTDFSRSFLPLNPSDSERWARVRTGVDTLQGLPPIEVYQVGDVYFVLDGHHRVSVARELGQPSIEAYVTPVYTRVPLTPEDRPDDLILKSEYDDFLNTTHLDELRPGADLLVTAPGQYPRLLEHISVHRYFMGQARHADVPYPEAVTDWYDHVYKPVADLIVERNLLRDFPGRTVTDLYLWIMDHRVELSGTREIGWEVSPETAAADLARRYGETPRRRIPRLLRQVVDRITPEPLEPGPPPGAWRAERQSPRRADHLFDEILVAVPDNAGSWSAVALAVEMARIEEARLTGLHAVRNEAEKSSEAAGQSVREMEERFTRACAEAQVAGRFMVETGQAAELLIQRSQWVDLVVFRLRFPPPARVFQRLRSGVRLLIRRSAAPLLVVPDGPAHPKIERALLAFGPGPKAEEALYLAAYLAGRRGYALTVVSVGAPQSPALLDKARQYLEDHDVQATYIEETQDAGRRTAHALLIDAEKSQSDLIIMGGYEGGLLREGLFGSTVDRVLRSSRIPVLICQ